VLFNDSGAANTSANLAWSSANVTLNIGGGTRATLPTLNVNGSASRPTFALTGAGTYAGTDTATGIGFILGVNNSGNRQLWIGDLDNFNSATATMFRYLTGSTTIASIDAITGDGNTRGNLMLGTDTTTVCVGDPGCPSTGSAYGAVFHVRQQANRIGLMVYAASTGTGNLQTWQNSSLGNLSVVTYGGNFGVRQTTVSAYLHIGAGTATIGTAPLKFSSGTLLTVPESGAMEYDGTVLYFSPSGTTRGSINIQGQTDVTIAANTNNQACAVNISLLRVNCTSPANLTGMTNGRSGRMVAIHNAGSSTLTLTHNDANSTAANRFGLPGGTSLTITAGQTRLCIYDSTSSLWRVT
jgi:hypothetical protein